MAYKFNPLRGLGLDYYKLATIPDGPTGPTEFLSLAADLIDQEDIEFAEDTLNATAGIASVITIDPSVASGQVTIEIFQDSGRLEKVYEYVIDLSDSTTYVGTDAFGFENGTTGKLYATLSCSGVAGGATANFSITAHVMEPYVTASSIPDTLGAGLENDGGGSAQIALATSSGLTLSDDKLAIDGDNTQPTYVSVNANGAYVSGAVDDTTNQTIAGEKIFDSAGLAPTVASGAPVSGTWNVGAEVLDSNKIKYRCITAGTPGTWELADTVTAETDVAISSAVAAAGGSELLELDVYGNVGNALWLRVWARRDSGTAEMQVPFRVRIYETTDQNGKELVWQGLGNARQTYIDTLLPASQVYLEVNDNNVLDVDEALYVYEDDDRYEMARCSGRSSGNVDIDEALVDASSWAINTLVIVASEWTNVPWINTDGTATKKILIEVRNDGVVADPDLVFYAQAKAMSLGVVR